jgi:hypothetical protein
VNAEDLVVGVVGIFSTCRLPEDCERAGRLLDLLADGMRPDRSDRPDGRDRRS